MAALGCDPRRACGKLAVEGRPDAGRDQGAQGRDVPGEAGRHAVARAHRRRRRLQLLPPRQEPEEDPDVLRSHPESRSHRQAHGGVHLQQLQRRMGLPLRLGLLLGHRSQGGRRCRRRQLEERERHRPIFADRLRAGQLVDIFEKSRRTGTRKRSAARVTRSRSSTRSSTAPSRTRRRFSRRCVPASSTCSSRFAGVRRTS